MPCVLKVQHRNIIDICQYHLSGPVGEVSDLANRPLEEVRMIRRKIDQHVQALVAGPDPAQV